MICPHCDKEFFSKQIRTCPHCRKSLEGYTGTTAEEVFIGLERREVKVDDSVKFSLALTRMSCGCGVAILIIVLLFFVLVFIIVKMGTFILF